MEDILEKEKQRRLKAEIQFARESSTTLPSVDLIFKNQMTMLNKRRREKTPQEFAESLMVFLGKKSEIGTMDYNRFKSSIKNTLKH